MLNPHELFIVSEVSRGSVPSGGVEAGGVRARQILLEGLHVFARKRRAVVIRNDQRRRLQSMNQRIVPSGAIRAARLDDLLPSRPRDCRGHRS